jgi:uncharacterized protein (TIGR02466 family)
MAGSSSSLIQISDKIAWMFATPVIALQWQDYETLNKDLESLILSREQADQNVTKTNAGGWQSDHNLLAWEAQCVNELEQRIHAMLSAVLKETAVNQKEISNTRFRLDCWANVNRAGDYNVVHSHPNSLWSGVYYVSSGEPDNTISYAGCIELLDPREATSFIQTQKTTLDQRCLINNKPGSMLMFPSWLKHMVHPHRGKGARISIAFNAMPAPD